MDTHDLPGRIDADAVVVGGGLAGLWGVLHLPEEWHIFVVDKERGPESGSSPWAQGGMAVATGPGDSPELHASDTMLAGAGACAEAAVQVLVEEAPRALEGLLRMGCALDRNPDGTLNLNREAGQSVARSVHAADATGREIMRVVVEWAKPRASRIVGSATKLLVRDGHCHGVEVATDHGDVQILARCVLLATGGCSALYAATTNPDTASGDGIALALRLGAEVADLEFVQFHPTALAVGGRRRVLLTEALRGEGAIVIDEAGKRFLFEHHPDGELGPRDVVARAIASHPRAYLDARPVGSLQLRGRFPNVVDAVADAGFDLTSERVPIEPAAHYVLGGVVTDLDGRTSVPGLYAAGECAATGVHGANRMAGNSLAEAVVFGRRAALAMGREAEARPDEIDPVPGESDEVRAFGTGGWDRMREAMSAGAGLVRTEESLRQAEETVRALMDEGETALGLAATAATAVCRSARLRRESRGVHYRADATDRDPVWDGARVVLRGVPTDEETTG